LLKNQQEKDRLEKFLVKYSVHDSIIRNHFGKDSVSEAELQAIPTENTSLHEAGSFMLKMKKNGFNLSSFREYLGHIQNELDYYLNPDFNPRSIVGDDPETDNGQAYGNPDVYDADGHGSHVSGIIAANRKDGGAMMGVAENVRIMTLRAVPDGDERDKDIARAIRYAVDNGASIINMSFGKALSPQKNLVDDAVKYAETKGVLLVHAAGNDNEDIDKNPHYPSSRMLRGPRATNVLTVGASSSLENEELPGGFTNYGRKSVDVMAPGVSIYSLKPGNDYVVHSGTSMATPVTAGVAAMLMSYYPELSASQVKEIIMASVVKYRDLKVLLPGDEKGKKVKFGTLSVTGGVINAFQAVKLAENIIKRQVQPE
jgi:subtilisin family serine protease